MEDSLLSQQLQSNNNNIEKINDFIINIIFQKEQFMKKN